MNFPDLLPKTTFEGSLQLEWKRCGRALCKCGRGLLHGPYVYYHWRQGRVQRKAYVPMAGLQQFLEAQDAFQAQIPRTCDIREIMRKLYDE